MKRYFYTIIIILASTFSALNIYAQDCDICSDLHRQMKDDSLFLSYISISDQMIQIYKSNSRKPLKGSLSASDILLDSTLTLEQKYTMLGYTGAEEVINLQSKLLSLQNALEKKYPAFASLSDSEQANFNEMAIKHYYSLKQ